MKNINCLFIFVIIILLTSGVVNAQSLIDVVYLNDGSILRGTIIEQTLGKSIKIELRDGSIFVIEQDRIDRIVKEPSSRSSSASDNAAQTSANIAQFPGVSAHVNPLGFAQFGPIVKIEIPIGNGAYFTPYIRFHALGAISQIIALDDDRSAAIDISSLGLACGLLQFKPTGNGMHGFYYGGFLEYGWISVLKDEQKSWAYRFTTTGITFTSNVGYRWRLGSFNVSLGLYGGAYFELSDQWWYIDPSYKPSVGSSKQNEEKDTMPFGMIEVTIGLEL